MGSSPIISTTNPQVSAHERSGGLDPLASRAIVPQRPRHSRLPAGWRPPSGPAATRRSPGAGLILSTGGAKAVTNALVP